MSVTYKSFVNCPYCKTENNAEFDFKSCQGEDGYEVKKCWNCDKPMVIQYAIASSSVAKAIDGIARQARKKKQS